jgi:hypothetical protein
MGRERINWTTIETYYYFHNIYNIHFPYAYAYAYAYPIS